ncbi:hypothetical protein BGZ83_011355, partial [Gryganskiella cystojenkinii]
RALKVFSTLFYQPSSSAQPGEIPWNDFLHAMTSVGFAVEKLYGSVWHFSPSLSSDKFAVWDRSIQFHEPHPIAKIPVTSSPNVPSESATLLEQTDVRYSWTHHQAEEIRLMWSNPDLDYEEFLSCIDDPLILPSVGQTRKVAKELATNIFKDWTALNHIILRHESLIQKRWLKKSREQRKAILLTGWPDMPTTHRPDFEEFLNEKLFAKTPTASEDVYLWPHINQEDLLKPKLFLTFLNARARHYPSAFVEADRDSFKFGITTGRIQPLFLAEHTMMLTGRNSPDAYGQLYSWKEHKESEDWIKTGKGELAGKGIQILLVQERVYSFLLECCLQILQDKSRESLETDTCPIEPEPPALSFEEGNVKSLAAISAIAPYRLPASLDLRRLRDLVEARKSAYEDNIWSLREDPSFFADTMMEVKEHGPEVLKDIYGQPHSLMLPHKSKELWGRVAKRMIGYSYKNLNTWTELHAKLDKTLKLQEKYESQIQSSTPLPVELLEAFLDLESSLYFYFRRPLITTSYMLVASPPMRSAFSRSPETKAGGNEFMDIVPHPTFAADKVRSRFRFLWQGLSCNYKREQIGKSILLDAIEHMIENNPKGKELVSSRVADMLEYLTLISECLNQISLYQPWASTFAEEGFKHGRGKKYMGDRLRRHEQESVLNNALRFFPDADVDPSYSRFYYPVDKRRTKETTEAMQQAERNLDEYWAKVDAYLSETTDIYSQGPLAELLKSRTMYRTLDWVEVQPECASSVPKAEHRVEDDVIKPLSQLYLDSERVDDSGFKVPMPRFKAKTRGVATTDKDQSVEPVKDDSESAAADPVFSVDKRALKVFSTLFYQPSSSAQPGEIPWNDFLHAMISVGFAVEKLYGSVWHFSPSPSSDKFAVRNRSIEFHEPHPIAKIPYRVARRIGRRLFRAYGWRGEMFKLESAQ